MKRFGHGQNIVIVAVPASCKRLDLSRAIVVELDKVAEAFVDIETLKVEVTRKARKKKPKLPDIQLDTGGAPVHLAPDTPKIEATDLDAEKPNASED